MIRLQDYWRSGAGWRMRIALGLKDVAVDRVTRDLRTGAQADPTYIALNPQRLVPALETGDGTALTQSLAIIEWLDETYTAPPLLPADPAGRAIVRAMAQTIACDVHPLHNLRVLSTLRQDFGADEGDVSAWIARWISGGFAALEAMTARHGGTYAYGDAPGLVECALVPKVGTAERCGMPLAPHPRLGAACEAARALPAVAAADPFRQSDADFR